MMCIVDELYANQHKLHVGDTITIHEPPLARDRESMSLECWRAWWCRLQRCRI